jgi:acetoin utilization deacetylase AcuC-like enzyme
LFFLSSLNNFHSLDLQNEEGETALHWAMRAGKIGLSVVRVLLENGARASLFNNRYQRPIDVAAEGFQGVCHQSKHEKSSLFSEMELNSDQDDKVDAIRQSRMNLFCFSPQSRTLLLHHPECLEHVPKSESDWEAPDRVTSIMNEIASNIREYEVQISTDFDKASLELLSRVHSAEYLTFVNNLSKELEKRSEQWENANSNSSNSKKDTPVVPFTPMVQRTMGRDDKDIKKGSHSDTSFSAGSLRAARRAAGAVKHAIDCVLVGRNRNAFCVVRPPGHHAGINGLLAGGESCGFCIFNNVAAGAMHALSDEGSRPKCERCAIVDIDAHHGNGTEEIVKRCDDPGRLFFFSVHLFDNDARKGKQNGFKFYPGTGDEDDVAHNIVNVPIAPMWREKELSQLVKMSPYNVSEGPSTRNKSKLKAVASKDGNVNGSESPKPCTSKSTPPHFFQGTGREAYRRAIQQRLIPALRAFNPDLIIISIGFDASKGDVGNARHYSGGKEVEGINLEPDDYAWTTRRVSNITKY